MYGGFRIFIRCAWKSIIIIIIIVISVASLSLNPDLTPGKLNVLFQRTHLVVRSCWVIQEDGHFQWCIPQQSSHGAHQRRLIGNRATHSGNMLAILFKFVIDYFIFNWLFYSTLWPALCSLFWKVKSVVLIIIVRKLKSGAKICFSNIRIFL